jgi:hypothetical protein
MRASNGPQEGTGSGTREGEPLMFREMHHADRNFRAMDFSDKMTQRRRHSLSATCKPSNWAWLSRMLFTVTGTTGSPQVEGRA